MALFCPFYPILYSIRKICAILLVILFCSIRLLGTIRSFTLQGFTTIYYTKYFILYHIVSIILLQTMLCHSTLSYITQTMSYLSHSMSVSDHIISHYILPCHDISQHTISENISCYISALLTCCIIPEQYVDKYISDINTNYVITSLRVNRAPDGKYTRHYEARSQGCKTASLRLSHRSISALSQARQLIETSCSGFYGKLIGDPLSAGLQASRTVLLATKNVR